MAELWTTGSAAAWARALEGYDAVVRRQGVDGLEALDRWARFDLPTAIRGRPEPYVELDELVGLTRWKMSRGVWRGRNLALVRSNDPEEVIETTRAALARMADDRAPIVALATLTGVGPATASAVAAAAAPERFPFFDDLVAAQIPGVGGVKFTVGEYLRYAAALREQAHRLGEGWTPALVERALWSDAGGKAGVA